MATIRALKDTSILEAPKPKPRAPSPAVLARQAEYVRLRAMIAKLTGPEQAYEVILEPGEQPLTIRARILTVAAELGKPVAVRTYGKGFAVGLLTPARQSHRGRRRRTTTSG